MKIAIAIGLSTVLAACIDQDVAPPPSDGAGTVRLTSSSPQHLAGDYVGEDGRRITFDSFRAGDVLTLDVRTADHVLVHVDTLDDAYRFSYMDGAAILTVEKAWVEEVQAEGPDGPSSERTDQMQWEGDPTVLDAELSLPEIADLPWMSRTLGELGYTGAAYPSSLALHKIARQSADALDIQVPPLVTTESNDRCSRPTANECYGMCGPGCTCWSWVCGDCCYHNGCAHHDSWCRQGQWYYCYNITAVIALFGC